MANNSFCKLLLILKLGEDFVKPTRDFRKHSAVTQGIGGAAATWSAPPRRDATSRWVVGSPRFLMIVGFPPYHSKNDNSYYSNLFPAATQIVEIFRRVQRALVALRLHFEYRHQSP